MAVLAYGSTQSKDPQIFQNCYRQFTRHLPPNDDPLLQSVRAGEISPVNGCLKLLSDFRISPEGNLLPNENGRAVDVLNAFHDLHASWFTKNDYFYYANDCQLSSMREIQDVTAPALYFDFALFDDTNKDLGYIADSRDGLFPLRSQGENPRAFFSRHQDLLAFGEGTEVFGRRFFGFKGRLIGIAKQGPDVRIKETLPHEQGGAPVKDVPLYRSLGPGFMGHPAYALRSGLRPPGYFPTQHSPAYRFAKELMHDLLCVDAPVLEDKDVANKIDRNSPLPYMRDARCLNCHATIYPLALTFRNFIVTSSGNRCLKGEDENILAIARVPEAETEKSKEAPFHRSRPEGKLYYRDYMGKLVSISHRSPEEMAEKIKESPQFYYCSARRYFEFLTGIDPSVLGPRHAAVTGYLNELTRAYLKHRKPKKVIESILRSEFYR